MSMNFKTPVLQQLDQMGHFADSPQMLHVSQGDISLQCEVTTLDRLSLAFSQVAVQRADLAGASLDQLKQLSQELAHRLSYLTEALATIEVDDQQCTIMLRSQPPSRDDGRIAYFEVLVPQGGPLTVARFEAIPGVAGRHQVPSELTRPIFGRLVQDLAEAPLPKPRP